MCANNGKYLYTLVLRGRLGMSARYDRLRADGGVERVPAFEDLQKCVIRRHINVK